MDLVRASALVLGSETTLATAKGDLARSLESPDIELATTREQSYSSEDEERRPGSMAVGVPVFHQERETIVGSICPSGPKTRIKERVEEDLIDEVVNAANVIVPRYNQYRVCGPLP